MSKFPMWAQVRLGGNQAYPDALAKLLILLVIGIQVTFCWMAKGHSLSGEVDLRAFYSAGTIVREGHANQLYDPTTIALTQQKIFGKNGRTLPFLYPAFAAIPFVPLSRVPYSEAFLIILLINGGLLYASAYLLKTGCFPKTVSSGWILALFLCFFPTSISLMQGQISCALLFVFALAHTLEGRGKAFAAGLCLSLALAKPQLVLPVVLLLFVWRRWRFVCGFLVGATGVVSLSVLLTGLQGAREYILCLRKLGSTMMYEPVAARLNFGMQTAAEPNLHGLMVTVAGAGTTSMVLLLAASFCALVLAINNKQTAETALPMALLVSYHLQPYDLVLLLLPLALLLSTLRKSLVNVVLGASILLLTVPVAPYLLVHGNTVWLVLAVCGITVASTLQHGRMTHQNGYATNKALAIIDKKCQTQQ